MIPTAVARESQGECPTCQYEKRASPNRQCTGGPSYNKSFIHSSFTNCMSSAWNTSRHSPYSSHRAHMGHRRVNKHCDCQVLGQWYVRRPCYSLLTMLLLPLHTWELAAWGSSTGLRRQLLTRSHECTHPSSPLLALSLSASHGQHSSQTTTSPFWFSLVWFYRFTGSVQEDLVSFPFPILTFIWVISPEGSRIRPESRRSAVSRNCKKWSHSLESLALKRQVSGCGYQDVPHAWPRWSSVLWWLKAETLRPDLTPGGNPRSDTD